MNPLNTEEEEEGEEKDEDEEEQPAKKKARKADTDNKPEVSTTTSTTAGPNQFDRTPDQLLTTIFGKLNGTYLTVGENVCKKWKGVLGSNEAWQAAFMNQWGKDIHPKRLEAIKALDKSWKVHFSKQHTWSTQNSQATIGYVDKAGDAAEYLVARLHNLHNPKDEFPSLTLHRHLSVKDVGDDVCYGPAFVFDPENTKKFYELAKDLTVEKIGELFVPGTSGFPKLLGGLDTTEPSARARDLDYVTYNFFNLQILLENAARRGNGLIRHHW